jgi:hypothetical protein
VVLTRSDILRVMSSSDPDEPTLGHAETVTPAQAPRRSPALADTAVLRPGRADARGVETTDAADAAADDAGDAPQIGERPSADRLARAVARARIANKLFAKNEQVQLGRYHLLEMVGAGGMGVVWGAWDPELERRVAIKLVKATMPAARDRIQLEGQALAKLSHPNVVTVYDVGVVEDQVYIVMEWVRGQNLRAYGATPRSLREIVAVYRAAGEGLAAAHAAGLIHRDFKPDNAIRGDDSRVRVLDFGLARNDVQDPDAGAGARGSDLTRGAGTPRYMPPEQAEGLALTPAVDQYAFCVSLREALVGRNADGKDADVPGWIAAILVRGTAREAKDRFPTLAELLRALARDPATIWRRRLIVSGALAATAAAFVIGNLRASGTAVEPCSGARQDIARTWNAAAQARMVGHLQTLGAYGSAEAARLGGELTNYAERWAASHRAACIASERGELTATIYERDLGCLARARVGLETAVDLLSRVPSERLSNAVVATRSLPDAERCLIETQASTVDAPAPQIAARANVLGNQLARLRVLAQAADPTVAAAAAEVTAEAQQLGYLPLLARAYLVQGLDLSTHDDPAALAMLERAATTALEAGDQVLFVEAYAREVFGVATTPKEALAEQAGAVLGAIPYVERIANRLGPAAAFERPLLLNNIGVSRMSAGDKASARTWFTRAIDEPRTRAGDLELVSAVGNLALISEQPAERDQLFARERQTLEALLGPNHLRTLEARYKASAFTARPDAAAAQLREVCRLLGVYHAREAAAMLSRCTYDLGWLAEERGDTSEARAAMQQVGDMRAPVAQAYLAGLDGDPARAIGLARAAAEGLQSEWWRKIYAGDALLVAAICAERLGRRSEALSHARAAFATYDELAMIRTTPVYLRRMARVNATLARLLVVDPASRPEAMRRAGEATDWYRSTGGYEAAALALEALR